MMDEKSATNDTIVPHPRPYSVIDDYEYLVYQPEKHIVRHYGSPPVTVVMRCHEGFEWNEQLFVNAYRQGRGRRHKSDKRKDQEAKIKQACGDNVQSTNDQVIEIELSDHDKTILP